MTASNAYFLISLLLGLVVALSGAYRYFSGKSSNAIKLAAANGESKGIQDSALRDNTAVLRELRLSMEKYIARTDDRMNKYDARLAVHGNRLDTLENARRNDQGYNWINMQRPDTHEEEGQ